MSNQKDIKDKIKDKDINDTDDTVNEIEIDIDKEDTIAEQNDAKKLKDKKDKKKGKKERKNENKKDKESKSEKKSMKAKHGLKSVLNDFMGEYKKIIWPSFKNLCKQTYTVIVTCLFFGAVIFCIDAAYGFCFEFMLNLLSSK